MTRPRSCQALPVHVTRAWRESGERTNPDVAEGDRKLLVLKPQVSVGELRVVDVERRLAVQLDDEMIAVGGDLIAIPFAGFERVLARGLRRSDDRARVVAC